ncbi:hypothetical protein MNBD_GAMMA21-1946 [hydrothermal vent metagenome]|uniref:Uncharacterized protein n=1 Tax=hydrothermal vent metagenome TaxID=652676 RepID=A0A3B1B344_9ZZZZ
MFFGRNRNRLIQRNEHWYVQMQMGFEGPFESKKDACEFLSLSNKADSARIEFMGIEDDLVRPELDRI